MDKPLYILVFFLFAFLVTEGLGQTHLAIFKVKQGLNFLNVLFFPLVGCLDFLLKRTEKSSAHPHLSLFSLSYLVKFIMTHVKRFMKRFYVFLSFNLRFFHEL